MKNQVTALLVAGTVLAPLLGGAYTSGGYVSSFTVSDIKTTDLGGNSYKDPIVLDANGGQGGPLLQYWVNDENFYDQNGYWEQYELPSCPFTRDGYTFSGWKVYDACRVGDEGYTFVDSNGGSAYIGGSVGVYKAGDSIDICGWTALVAQWREKQATITFGNKWYEAIVKGVGVTMVGWKDFWMGGNVAIPVTVTDGDGNSYELSPENITIKPGTYIDYGEPYIMSESDMWNTYGSPIFDVRNSGRRIDLEKDGGVWVYNTWDWEERFDFSYELEKGIWPFFDNKYSDYDDVNNWIDAHSDRQWIIIPTGTRAQKGTHTFTVSVKVGGKTAKFAVSFTMSPDQKARAATVRFNANGGTVSEYGRVVNLNKAIGELPEPEEREGYTFKGWYTAKTKGTKISAAMKVTKAMTVYAQWSPKKYWVYYQDKINGTVNTGSGTKMSGMGKHAVGSKVTIKVEPINKNYVFSNWDWGMPDEIVPKKWRASPAGSEYTTFTFTMPPEDVMIVGYGMKKSADRAPRFTIDCGSTWYVEDQEEVLISIDSGSFPKLNTNKSIPAGMKLVRVQELRDYDCQCQYILKVSNRTKLPKGTIKTVKLTATNRSGMMTTKSFKIVMPNKTQAVDKGVLELNTSPMEPYELKAGMKFSWNDLGIAVAEGWKITAITGIPGLEWDANKQKMTGIPSKGGTYAASFTVVKGTTKYAATATFKVEALPKTVVGSFYGYCTPPKLYDYSNDDDFLEYENPYAFGKQARKVTVTVSESGKITAKIGSVTLSGTGFSPDEHHGDYRIVLNSEKKYKTYSYVNRLVAVINPDANFTEDALIGTFGYGKVTPMTGALNSEDVFARKNAAATDAEAKAIAARYAKLGKQSLIVIKASSDSGYAYDLACPNCVLNGDKAKETVFLKIEKNGKVTLSGTIAGTKVSGTTYLTYEYVGEDRLMVVARFFVGKFVIEIQGDTEYFFSNGSLNGRAWKK